MAAVAAAAGRAIVIRLPGEPPRRYWLVRPEKLGFEPERNGNGAEPIRKGYADAHVVAMHLWAAEPIAFSKRRVSQVVARTWSSFGYSSPASAQEVVRQRARRLGLR